VIEVGQPAPDFSVRDQHGRKVTLSMFSGQPVVLYFYPKDNTPGCTTEACAFRDDYSRYEKAGAKVIGLSPDTVQSHQEFAEDFQLLFTLVADTERKVCESFGVWQEKNMYGKKSMGVVRSTFVIDRARVVRRVFRRVNVDGHSEAVLKALEARET
jgi:peroxiredoxin Q/BCP